MKENVFFFFYKCPRSPQLNYLCKHICKSKDFKFLKSVHYLINMGGV